MATVTIEVDEAVRDELERVALRRGCTVNELLKQSVDLLAEPLDAVSVDESGLPVSLPITQRRTFELLHLILAEVSGGAGGDSHRRHAAVMREGFAGEYPADFGGMQTELTVQECAEVGDILAMFTVLDRSTARLPEQDRAQLTDTAAELTFDGFSSSDWVENRYLSLCRFLVVENERWSHFRELLGSGDRGDAPVRRLPRYRRLLAAYRPVWLAYRSHGVRPPGLTVAEINRIASTLDSAPS